MTTVTDDLDRVPPVTPPGRGRSVLQFLRNTWRGLTSMRTALILLFLLALASMPGALLPQWSLNQTRTREYIEANPTWGPIANALGLFEVFASPWYAAIYLSLFLSLVGCLLPRCWDFAKQLRAEPVRTPRNLARMPLHTVHPVDDEPQVVADRVETALRRKHWRVVRRTEPGGVHTVSAEKGYLREVGNLVFHFSLLGLLVAVAIGKLFGYEGSVITRVGAEFCSTNPSQYDNFRPGLTVDGTDMQPFCVDLKTFDAKYSDSGQPLDYSVGLSYQFGSDPATGVNTDHFDPYLLRVNEPLRMNGERLYLLGHGYAPEVQITFPDGQTRTASANFISNDPTLLSSGAIKITDPPGASLQDLTQRQLALRGLFAPTAFLHGEIMTSSYPAATKPGLAVAIYRGDLGLETGRSQSIYSIDENQVSTGKLKELERVNLYIGDTTTLDDGTKITFTGYRQWVSLQTSYDPGQTAALVFAITLLGGLMVSLTIKRRRVWFRVQTSSTVGSSSDGQSSSGGGTRVEVGGLARTDQAGYGSEFSGIAALVYPQGLPVAQDDDLHPQSSSSEHDDDGEER
ncbi:MAG: cytochrome c biogenesis protein ResB [Nakamurella sp.]